MRFEGLRETLLRGGIAPRHVRRYLRELEDHLCDLNEAQRAAGHDQADATARALALLGNEEELAAAMLAQPGFKSLPARAPWLVFGLAPPLAIIALFFATMLALILVGPSPRALEHGAVAPEWFQVTAKAIALLANFGLGPGLAALTVWAARRQRLNWKWPLLAAALIALLGAHMAAYFPQQGRSTLSLGVMHMFRMTHSAVSPDPLRVNPPGSWVEFLLQFFLTLAPALWLLRDRMFARPAEPR